LATEAEGPEATENHCFTATYSSSGYEVSFREQCAATLNDEVLGGATGEATSLRAAVDVTFLSSAERASTVGLWCFYDHSKGDWARAYSFILSPDGSHSIVRVLNGVQSSTVLASSVAASSVSIGKPNVVEADCARSARSLILVLAINGSDILVAEDQSSDDASATFGDPSVAFAGATVGFRAAVKNFRVTELRGSA
jgi:hypothetical protein